MHILYNYLTLTPFLYRVFTNNPILIDHTYSLTLNSNKITKFKLHQKETCPPTGLLVKPANLIAEEISIFRLP